MAERLSENPAISVAVIEAGTYYQVASPLLASTPSGDVIGVGSDPSDTNLIDWNFITSPQAGANGRSLHYAQGKTLGGRSVITMRRRPPTNVIKLCSQLHDLSKGITTVISKVGRRSW